MFEHLVGYARRRSLIAYSVWPLSLAYLKKLLESILLDRDQVLSTITASTKFKELLLPIQSGWVL